MKLNYFMENKQGDFYNETVDKWGPISEGPTIYCLSPEERQKMILPEGARLVHAMSNYWCTECLDLCHVVANEDEEIVQSNCCYASVVYDITPFGRPYDFWTYKAERNEEHADYLRDMAREG